MIKDNNNVEGSLQIDSTNLSEMELIKQTLMSQNEHGNAIVKTINYMESMNKKVDSKFNQIDQETTEMREMQAKLEKEITLKRGEQGRLKSAVLRKSEILTHQFFKNGVTNKLWNAKRGHTISYIWIVLKNFYDVATYPEISHVEFENAIDMINQLTIEDFPRAYYRLTDKMQEIAVENNDRVFHVYFGENMDQANLL